MKCLKLTQILALLAVLALTAFAAAACGDDDEDTDDGGTNEIAIMEPFGRATLDTASAYFTIRNNGDRDDALVGASAPVADMVALHEVVTEGAETPSRRARSPVEAWPPAPSSSKTALR